MVLLEPSSTYVCVERERERAELIMTPSKMSKAAQGTIEVIMRLAFVIRLPVSTLKQLFTFSNIVLCHPALSSISSSLPFFSSSLPHLLSHSLFLLALFPNHKCYRSLVLSPTLFFPQFFHFVSLLSFRPCFLKPVPSSFLPPAISSPE